MGFGVSFRVAPGVRLRASSRGIRASVGPRAARVHMGAGRTAVSTGAGPVTFYQTLGGAKRPSAGGRPRPAAPRSTGQRPLGQRPTLAQLERQAKADALAAERFQVEALERQLTSLHWESFPMSHPAVVPQPPATSRAEHAELERRFRRAALAEIPWTKRADRAEARAVAAQQTADFLRVHATGQVVAAQLAQFEEDERWQGLVEHDPHTVIDAVDSAFADNASDSTCIDAGEHPETRRRYVTVVVVFGTPEMVPERKAALTPTGRPTLHKRSKTERNSVYLTALASTVLATVKEAFAVAVSADDVNVVVLQSAPGEPRPRPIYLGQFGRRQVEQIDWPTVDPVSVVRSTAEAQLSLKGVSRTVTPLVGLDGIEQIAESFTASG